MLNFGEMERQKEQNYGPVPGGSSVRLIVNLEKPKFSHERNEYVAKTKNGLLGLWCQFVVDGGQYDGVQFRQNIWLPPQWQEIQLTEGQRKAATFGGAQLRAIIESARGINPDDGTAKAAAGRQISDFIDIDGMIFAAKLRIAKDPYVSKEGNYFWNNELSTILTPDMSNYANVMAGNEIINEGGPVEGKGTTMKEAAASVNGTASPDQFEPADNRDKVPF